jgi:hypothetical protein
MKKKGPFDYIKQITSKKEPKDFEYDKKICNGYLLSFFLSHSMAFLPIVQKMNKIQYYVKDEFVYDYYFNLIPRGYERLNLIKKAKENKEEIEKIQNEYDVSKREARLIKVHKERLNENITRSKS